MKTLKSLLALGALLVAARFSAAAEVNLFGWSEYVPQEVLDGFTAETGIKVNFETYASNEELLSKLVAGAGAYDLIQPSDYAAEVMIRRGMLAPLDAAKLPNLKNIGSQYRALPHDPSGKFTVPYMTGTVGIVVNTEKVKDPIKGYKDVFQDKHKDRLVVLNDNREIVTWALYSLGLAINEITPASLAKARLLNGDVDIGVVWSGEAALLWNENKKFQYVLPAEGAHMFVDTLCIPATAKNKDAAHALINYILRPEVSKIISDKFPYTNPNLAARKLLTPAQLANPASYPTSSNARTFRDIGTAAADIDKLVTDLKSAQ